MNHLTAKNRDSLLCAITTEHPTSIDLINACKTKTMSPHYKFKNADALFRLVDDAADLINPIDSDYQIFTSEKKN